MKKFLLLLPLTFIFLTSACSMHEDPRSMASNRFDLTYDGNQCTPYESFVPMGQEIEISLNNDSDYDITWYLIFGPIDGKFEDQDPQTILASASSKAGQITTSTFTAPNLPARYDSFCVRDIDSDQRALTYLLVVQPYED